MENDKSLRETLLEKKRKEIEAEMAPIFEGILNYPMPHGTIREEFFVQVFLPFFAGETTEDDFPNGISMHTWNQIAGHMGNPVDVVDANNNILFTVPPINDLSYIVQNPDTAYSPMSNVGAYAETLRNSARPDEVARADSVIAKELRSRIPARLRNVKEERYREWAKIFLRYGYFLPDDNKESSTNSKDTSSLLEEADWD